MLQLGTYMTCLMIVLLLVCSLIYGAKLLSAHCRKNALNIIVGNNCRGISLLCMLGKVFTKILNSRMIYWASFQQKLDPKQDVQHEDKFTTDHIFTLMPMAEKYLSRAGGRFYCVCSTSVNALILFHIYFYRSDLSMKVFTAGFQRQFYRCIAN